MAWSLLKSLVACSILVMLAGCGNNYIRFGMSERSQTFTQGEGVLSSNNIDIMWVVDNSASMVPLQTNLTQNFNNIVNIFRQQGYDYQMAVTATDAYLGDPTLSGYLAPNAPLSLYRDGAGTNHSGFFILTPNTPNIDTVFVTNASQGSGSSGDERAFSSFRAALNNPSNPKLMRPGAFLSVIILSDEDDFSGNTRPEYGGLDHDYTAVTLDPVQSYVDYLDSLTGTSGATRRYNVNAIAVTNTACLNALQGMGNGSIIGQRYMDIVQKTNGVLGDICDASFAQSLKNIANKIISLSTQFYLTKVPQVDTIRVWVDNRFINQDSANGWTYNAAANSIMFNGNSVPKQGASIKVNYTPVSL